MDRATRLRLLVVLPLLAAALIWASWPSLREMATRWSRDPRYSHGYLVPAFAAFLLWQRRRLLDGPLTPAGWWGTAVIGAATVLRLVGSRFYIAWFEALSIPLALAGIALLVGGWRAFRWSGPSVAFLVFMIPLPYRIENALGSPLQRLATIASEYALQTMGLPAVAEGNIILLGDTRIGVVEACNGLGMLFMFLAFAAAVALVVPRSPLDRGLILLSAIPIALAANIARITVTGLLYEVAGSGVAHRVYHDLAGWLMMPMALAALWLELALLSRLLVEPEPEAPALAGLLHVGRPTR